MPRLTNTSVPGEIHANVLYRLEEIQKRANFGSMAMRTARHKGLPVLYMGGCGFVYGEDFIKFVREHAERRNPTMKKAVDE